jgi:hypothetical protein
MNTSRNANNVSGTVALEHARSLAFLHWCCGSIEAPKSVTRLDMGLLVFMPYPETGSLPEYVHFDGFAGTAVPRPI